MPKVVGVVGYKDSGKTTLTGKLASELIGRGYEVAVIKHLPHHVDLPGKDTAILGEVVGQVGFVSPHRSGVFWKKPLSLENLLPYLPADLVLVEGFKGERTFPKIACLRGMPDDAELFDGLTICAVAPAEQMGGIEVPDNDGLRIPLLDRDDVGGIADMVEQKAFKLPNLDCGGCGHERCYDLARDIVAGQSGADACVSLDPPVEVKIDGRPLPLNPFVAGIVRGTVLGMLASLKGFKKGKVEIRF